MHRTGEFNKFGDVTDTETQAHGKASLEAGATIKAGAATTFESETETGEAPVSEQVDQQVDQRVDDNGQFVDGNQEAAATSENETVDGEGDQA